MSSGDNCGFPLVNAGILSVAPYNPQLSAMLKPRSAKTRSPGRSFPSNPQCSVINLSDTRPPHPLEMKDTVPCGVIPIRNLAVLWCLYEDQVCAHANRSEGLSINTSKQSMMTAHDGKFSLKHLETHRHSYQKVFSIWPVDKEMQ